MLNNVMNAVKNGLTVLSKMPKISKFIVVISLCVALAASAIGLTSCGNISKIVIKSDPNNISIAVSQTSNDSTAVNVNVNPILNLSPNVKENETQTR